ncbi:MAG TPA: hypothetical protein VEE87_00515 [archaeon]|nr:hypothetical protein [archaeon]
MSSPLEYHFSVRHSSPASVVLFSQLVVSVILSCSAFAQINGAPSSVTSPGFGGRAINGTPASVTSLGRNGYSGGRGVTFSTSIPPLDREHHRRHHYVEYSAPVVYALPVPYAVDIGETDNYADANADDANYQGGPTIFDRRGSGADSYIPPVRNVPRPHAAQSADDDSPAPQPPDPTILVFKDGHKLEVGNYAIVGAILFDLTPGHARRIALADLDLEATRKQNDEHGVIFQLPTPVQAN